MTKLIYLIALSIAVVAALSTICSAQLRKRPVNHNILNIKNPMGYPGYPFPIQPGNMWVYESYDGYFRSLGISEQTLIINNKTFYKMIGDGQISNIGLRLDSSGFYEMHDSPSPDTVVLQYYKNNAALGDFWVEPYRYHPSVMIQHMVYDTGAWALMGSNTVVYGVKAVRVTLDSAIAFIDDIEIWSEKFGLIQSIRDEDGLSSLVACRIDGKAYGDTNYLLTTAVHPTNVKEKIFSLSQNYPNPFNPETVINYQLGEDCMVVLKVCNMLGETVSVLVNQEQQSGFHSVTFDGGNMPSGIYFYSLQSGNSIQTKKMILLR